MIFNNELQQVFCYPQLFDSQFWLIMTIGGISGFAIGFLTSLQIKVSILLYYNKCFYCIIEAVLQIAVHVVY